MPNIPADADNLGAALAYAEAGWYVLPVKNGSKHPGSVVGKGWHTQSSRDPKVTAAWFAGTDYGIALHCGRSGAVVLDVDKADAFPEPLRHHLLEAPYQSTRPGETRRGHYIFATPPGRNIGNSVGKLGGKWGEVRAANGVIIVAPSLHAAGGEYDWQKTGPAPLLPADIADLLPDATGAVDAATDAAVAAFIAEHEKADRPDILNGLTSALAEKIEDGESVHTSTLSVVTGALKEARAGYYSAQLAIGTLKPIFKNAVALGGSTGKVRTGAAAESEWDGILAWAVGQASAANLDEVHGRVADKMPEAVTIDAAPGNNPGGSGQDDSATAGKHDFTTKLWHADQLKTGARPRWLARNRIPHAAVSLLVGDEGIGKSLFWVWLTYYVTTGKPCPEFGIPARDPGHIILVCTEDDWQTTVRPRLEVARVNLDMVRVICTDDDGSGAPVFPRDLHLIRDADPAPTLVVVDAWLDTVPGHLKVRDPQHAREALHPWKDIATATGAALLLLTHTNRVASGSPRDKYGITGELRKVARMTLFAQAADDDTGDDSTGCGHLLIGPEKANTTRTVAAAKFTITSVQHFEPSDDFDGTVPRLDYAGDSSQTAREHIAESFAADAGATDGDDAVTWLAKYLAAGPRWSKQLHDDRENAGIGEKKLRTAKNRLRVESRRGDDERWFMALPEHKNQTPDTLDALGVPVKGHLGALPSSQVRPHAPLDALYDAHTHIHAPTTCEDSLGAHGDTRKTSGHLLSPARAPNFCPGCGTYPAVHGTHRADCTAVSKQKSTP